MSEIKAGSEVIVRRSFSRRYYGRGVVDHCTAKLVYLVEVPVGMYTKRFSRDDVAPWSAETMHALELAIAGAEKFERDSMDARLLARDVFDQARNGA